MNATSSTVRRLACVALMTYGFAARVAMGNESIFRNALPSTVFVISPVTDTKSSLGTGVVIDCSQRTAVTAWHVVEDRRQAVVFFAARDSSGAIITSPDYYKQHIRELGIVANVVAADPGKDLAVLQLQTMPTNVTPVPLAARSAETAENVHAIGNSGIHDGTLWRYSSGTVRSVYETAVRYKRDDGSFQNVSAKIVETQCPTNPGDSGGPILNDAGQLVAITSGSASEETNVEYGIDVTEIRAVMNGAGLACGAPTQLVPPEAFVERPPMNPLLPAAPVQPAVPARPAVPAEPAIPAQPMQAAGEAAAQIDDVRTVPDITFRGERGLEVHVDLKTDNVRGVPCTLAAIIADENGRPYRAASDAFTAPGTQAKATTTRLTARFDHSTYKDVVLFIPYDEMISGLQDANLYQFTILVDVYSQTDHRWITRTAGQAIFRLHGQAD